MEVDERSQALPSRVLATLHADVHHHERLAEEIVGNDPVGERRRVVVVDVDSAPLTLASVVPACTSSASRLWCAGSVVSAAAVGMPHCGALHNSGWFVPGMSRGPVRTGAGGGPPTRPGCFGSPGRPGIPGNAAGSVGAGSASAHGSAGIRRSGRGGGVGPVGPRLMPRPQ